MTTRTHRTVRRTFALTAAAAVVSVGVLTTLEPASAVSVGWSAWDQGTSVTLTSAETTAAIRDGIYSTGSTCSAAINLAISSGIPFPDQARSACPSAVIACAQHARSIGNALSGVRLYADGTYRCLDV